MSTNPIMDDPYYVRNLPHIQKSTFVRQLKSCVAGSSCGAMPSVRGLGGYCGCIAGFRPFRHYKSLMSVGLGVSTASTARRASVPAGNSKGREMTTSVSERVVATDAPCIVKTKKLMAGREGVLSLAQGIVHWPPPQEALERAQSLVLEPGISGYGPADGLPELRDALREKLERENGLPEHDVMITAGANQAFTNVVLALVDECDPVVLFRPYYFNHLMALQMTGGAASVVFGECDPATLHPDIEWLERAFASASPPKMVVVVNPCNPTGVLMSAEELDRVARMCGDHGAWLVVDNTYEHFCYEGRSHYCPSGDHIVHLFSFSKAYGMMGWRVGYIAYPRSAAGGQLGAEILKVQDTIPICPTQLSQHVALTALQLGRGWVDERIAGLTGNREALIDALSPLGAPGCGVAGGEGAIYLWAKLPPGCEDDEAVVRWLVEKHGVCLIPGSSCGCPGFVRAAFANLQSDTCADASARLKAGLQELVAKGITAVAADLASSAAP